MLTSLLRGDIVSAIVYLISSVFVVFCTLPVHEFAHAFTADKLGDHTARSMGRLTLNPFAHIDWLGAAMILLVGFGWAKPVPVNGYRLHHPKRDMALVALAGPLSNLILGFLMLLLLHAVSALFTALHITGMITLVLLFFSYAALINIQLAIFNLIPVPPLDGSRILAVLLPDRLYYKLMQYEQYLYIILMVLLITGALTTPLSFLSTRVYNGLSTLAGLPFSWIH